MRERDLVGRQGHFIAEGEVVLRVLLASRHQPVSLLLADKRLDGLRALLQVLDDGVPVYTAPQPIIDGIAGFPLHRGILALGRRAPPVDPAQLLAACPPRALVVVLSAIANHDNMGGLFRNAAAFGADAVLLDAQCCDPLYRKAIRVSVGGCLKVPFARIEAGTDIPALLASQGFTAIALSPSAETPLSRAPRPERTALLFGAEGPGLPADLLARTQTVGIPMTGGFDSLNVATTSGIALYHFTRD
ncbi:TrmH family RNA methyltransferase [Telmatospirillum siberiense]|uniref:TrmH family RNA methyltransferase n=1 Tax=Telmatospirillum siberiense TaxID=382514 RepID=UPI001F53A83C|nr:RNA methyltransferase [Telmatospirillum siberiense]